MNSKTKNVLAMGKNEPFKSKKRVRSAAVDPESNPVRLQVRLQINLQTC